MKMYFIVYDSGFNDEVNNVLTSCGIKGFTKWTQVLGKGEKSDPKMGDSIWPEYNFAIVAAIEEDEESKIKEALKSLYEKNMGNKGLRVYNWPVEQVI